MGTRQGTGKGLAECYRSTVYWEILPLSSRIVSTCDSLLGPSGTYTRLKTIAGNPVQGGAGRCLSHLHPLHHPHTGSTHAQKERKTQKFLVQQMVEINEGCTCGHRRIRSVRLRVFLIERSTLAKASLCEGSADSIRDTPLGSLDPH